MRDPYITDGTTRAFANPPAPPRRGLRPPSDPWVVVALMASGTALVVAVAGLVVAAQAGKPGPGPVAAPPETESPSAEPTRTGKSRGVSGSGKPKPTATRLAWRSELLSDGSTRMVVGDIEAAPKDPSSIAGSDYRAKRNGKTKIVKAHGWWCATKVSAAVSYANRRLHSPGFSTWCSGRPGTMRQRYAFERSSWSGFRSYTGDQWSPWTAAQSQSGGALSVPCPAGRTGTYDYRLSVTVEISGKPVGPATALSNDRYRGDCGTGVS